MTGTESIRALAALLAERNAIDARLAAIVGRPPTPCALGEFVASLIFDIELEVSAVNKGVDGRFRTGPLAGMTVDVKCYGKREELLDLPSHDTVPDWHLVLTGPSSPAVSSRGTTRPFTITGVYLFRTPQLITDLRTRGVKIGIATSVAGPYWNTAELYPTGRCDHLWLTDEQRALIGLLALG